MGLSTRRGKRKSFLDVTGYLNIQCDWKLYNFTHLFYYRLFLVLEIQGNLIFNSKSGAVLGIRDLKRKIRLQNQLYQIHIHSAPRGF